MLKAVELLVNPVRFLDGMGEGGRESEGDDGGGGSEFSQGGGGRVREGRAGKIEPRRKNVG